MNKSLYLSTMKNIGFYFVLLFIVCVSINKSYANSEVVNNSNQNDILALLKQTQQQLINSPYSMKFIVANNSGINSYKLQHVKYNNKQLNQIISLDGITNIIIQQDNLISYLSPNNSYSIKSEYITDYIPPIFTHNLDKISQNYIFIDLGYERVGGIKSRAINIVSKTGFSYQYKVWIDDEQKYLIQANLLDQNEILLEQFKVVNIKPLEKIEYLMQNINSINRPPLIDDIETDSFKWRSNWLPNGFVRIKNYSYQVDDSTIESSIYSDGLFTFTIYIAPKILENSSENYYNNGKTNIYSQTRNDKEITIIGQIPLPVAKNIIEELKLNTE